MNTFRTHNCGDLTVTDINSEVKISGWLNKKRDHGGLLWMGSTGALLKKIWIN